ncbi:MAG: hypothetical protein R3246_15395, partial [Acidimicrobiia bacterium]|nr:hypothetical protein [Acidimicrobiia bacterium]
LARAELSELELGWNRSIRTMASVHIRIARGEIADALEVALTNRGWDDIGLILDGTRNRLGIVYAAAAAGRADAWERAIRSAYPPLSISLGGRADGDVLIGFAAWETFHGDPIRGSELLATIRAGRMEFPETFIKYWDLRNRLIELDLDPDSVRQARARGAATPIDEAIRQEYDRRGWDDGPHSRHSGPTLGS